MISYRCEKYYNGYASVRSFDMEWANKKHEVMEITLDGDLVPNEMRGQKMRVNSKTPYKVNGFPQTAKYDGKNIKAGDKYYLWDYQWTPIKEVPDEYNNEGREKLLSAWKKLKAPKQMKI